MKPKLLTDIVSIFLILLWLYAAGSKLADFDKYVWELKNQVFSLEIALALVVLIPLSEVAAVVLLFFDRTVKYGLILSAVLLTAFSIYIITLLTGAFERVPCACGGILGRMDWKTHLYFNLIFLAVTLSPFVFMMQPKERRLYELNKK